MGLPPCDECYGQGWTEDDGLCIACAGTGRKNSSFEDDDDTN